MRRIAMSFCSWSTITAQVTEAVFDTPTGRIRLIPQGARLIGTYDSQVAFGQSRVLLVWTRLIMPNGRSIVLERQPGADVGGYSGLEDEVDNHWKELLGAAALSTLLAVGTEVNAGTDVNNTNSAIIQALRRGAGDSLSQTGQQVVRRNLNTADADHPSRISGESDRESRSRARTL
jgi:type IV secretion system protein VirB10